MRTRGVFILAAVLIVSGAAVPLEAELQPNWITTVTTTYRGSPTTLTITYDSPTPITTTTAVAHTSFVEFERRYLTTITTTVDGRPTTITAISDPLPTDFPTASPELPDAGTTTCWSFTSATSDY